MFLIDLGDASSPHGSNCMQFNGNGVGGDGSKSSSPSLPASSGGNDGLSRQQLDLISQIMQQTKPNVSLTTTTLPNGQKSIPRPRTWNIQVSRENAQLNLFFRSFVAQKCAELKDRISKISIHH